MAACPRRIVSLLALTVLGLACTTSADAQPRRFVAEAHAVPVGAFDDDPLATEAMRSDARLHDVQFADEKHGWAVGDRGSIWHTADGGRSWQLQPSGVTCPLRAVWFADRKNGFAAGGRSHPYTHTSSGVVLRTRDGGRHWSGDDKLPLPGVRQLGMFDDKNGWAAADTSAMYPSGVLKTETACRGFLPVVGGRTGQWLAADFLGPHHGVLAGRMGTTTVVKRGALEPNAQGLFGLRNLRAVRLAAPIDGWLTGDGGLVLRTGDAGATWQLPPGPLPGGATEQFDFHALAVRGEKCWVAGSPGTRVFFTPDAGQNWHAQPTGSQVPIYALSFVDDNRGWAVGALGSILATEDGGRSWRRQRSGGTRAALMGLFATAGDVPLELLVRLCGQDGYLGVVETLARGDVDLPPSNEVHLADRLHEAVVAAGASDSAAAWQFPIRQAGLKLDADRLVDLWNQSNDGQGMQNLTRHVVREIRVWRPEVIVTHEPDPTGRNPLGHLVSQAVLEAVERAADPTSFPEQITHIGLSPWKTKKVFASLGEGAHGATDLSTSQLATRLGGSLADVAVLPRALIEDRFHAAPASLAFRELVHQMARDGGRDDFFSGIVLYPGGEARRELFDPPAQGLAMLRQTAQRRRNVRAIIERAESDAQGSARLVGQTAELVRGLDETGGGRVLYHLAEQLRRTGRWTAAAETLELLVERYPEHPLARSALLWLVQYYASGEAAWRVQGRQRMAVRQASTLSIDATEQGSPLEKAAAWGRQVERTLPELYAEPALRFPLAVAQRRRGYPRDAEQFFLMQARSATDDAWRRAADAEEWLAQPRGVSPMPIVHCAPMGIKPRLDGRLDDAAWQQAKPARLTSAAGDDTSWPAAVMLAYDQEFLYVAATCRQAPGTAYPEGTGPRPRDADLSARDRVEVLLDIDRDYASYYRLAIDHRGWVAEDCWGDATWNPTWFVAAETAEGTWTVEAAVPLEELIGDFPKARTTWAVGLQRVIPGVGLQSWTTPAAVDPVAEGFGHLIFD